MYTYASGGGGAGSGGSGDVVGPASSTDNAVARFDSTTGKLLQDSGVTVSDVAGAVVTIASVPGASPGTALVIDVPEPAGAAGASVAGKPLTLTASDAVASTDTAGAAAGGAVNITAGAAKRNTSGNADGGGITLVGGAGIGTGSVGPTTITGNLLSSADGTYNIGGAAGNRFRITAYGLSSSGAAASGELNWADTTNKTRISSGNIQLGSGVHFAWSAGDPGSVATDSGFVRAAVGLLRVSNGSTGIGNVTSGRLVAPEITSPETIAVTDSRKCITNTGAGGAVTYNLPAAALGLEYYFVVTATQDMVVDAAGTDTIRVAAGVSAAGGTATNGTIGSTLHLCCVVAGQWFAIDAPNGIWTLSV